MAITISANNLQFAANKTVFTDKNAPLSQNNTLHPFSGNESNDPIALKRAEAGKKALKVISDAWDTDRSIDQSIESRREHYKQMSALRDEARAELRRLDEQSAQLKKEYDITENMNFKDCPAEYQSRYLELKDQADQFKKEISDATELMKDDVADIRAITLERLKSNPMLDAQETAEAIYAAADEDIIGIAMQESKEHIEEKMEETKEQAEKEAEKQEIQEEKLEDIKEARAMQKAFIEGTQEAVREAEARQRENESPKLPLDDLLKLVETNSETGKAQKTLQEIKASMNLLEADLMGLEVDEEI